MKITTISYSKTIPTGPYMNERIGIEAELEENELPEAALSKAKLLIDKWHIENNPQLYADVLHGRNGSDELFTSAKDNATFITQPIGLSIESIQSCKSIKELEIYELLIDKTKDQELKRKLFMAYEEKFKELNQ